MRVAVKPLSPSLTVEVDKTPVNGVVHNLIQHYDPVTRVTTPTRSEANPMILHPVLHVYDPNKPDRNIAISRVRWQYGEQVIGAVSNGAWKVSGKDLHVYENITANTDREFTVTAYYRNPYTNTEESISTNVNISTTRGSVPVFSLEPTTPVITRVDPTVDEFITFSFHFECGIKVKAGTHDYTMTGRDMVMWETKKNDGEYEYVDAGGANALNKFFDTDPDDIDGIYRVRATVSLEVLGSEQMTQEFIVIVKLGELQAVNILPMCPVEVAAGSIKADTPLHFRADVIVNGRSVPNPQRFYDIAWEVPNPIRPEVAPYRFSGVELNTTMYGAFGDAMPTSTMPTVSVSVTPRKTSQSPYYELIGAFTMEDESLND